MGGFESGKTPLSWSEYKCSIIDLLYSRERKSGVGHPSWNRSQTQVFSLSSRSSRTQPGWTDKEKQTAVRKGDFFVVVIIL